MLFKLWGDDQVNNVNITGTATQEAALCKFNFCAIAKGMFDQSENLNYSRK